MDPAYWVSPESSCHCENDLCIGMRATHRIHLEKEKRLSTSYLQLLIILDFWHFSEWCLCSGGAYAPSNTIDGLAVNVPPEEYFGV